MKTTFLVLLSITITCRAQNIEKINFTASGCNPIVIKLDSIYTKEIIYKLTREWILKDYNTPSVTIKAEINNDYIRINGVDINACKFNALSTLDLDYDMTIEVKDGRYRLTVVLNKFLCNHTICDYGFSPSGLFKKDGSARGIYSDWVQCISNDFNKNSLSLYKYITGDYVKKEW